MADAKIKIRKNIFQKWQERLVESASGIDAGLARDIYTIYQNAQRRRWMSENASEGSSWKPLNPVYAKYKRKRFKAYEGGGRKMLIATGKLFGSVTGMDLTFHRRLVEKQRMIISTTLPYAKYVAEVRPFMTFGARTRKQITNKLREFYFGRR